LANAKNLITETSLLFPDRQVWW